MTAAPDILIRDLVVRYGRREVLQKVNLEIARGTTTVLLGPNGSGKSTLLRACLGVVKRRAGRIEVGGHDPAKERRHLLQDVGYVPDKPDAYPWMTVEDLFRFLAPHHPGWDDGKAWSLIQQLDVPLGQPFATMSRGEGMKAMLVAALAHEPRILLLDEPFGGLDPLVKEEVLKSVIGALADAERTILLATHDLEVAARVADRVAVLANGRVRREGTVDEIEAQPEPTPTARRLHEALSHASKEV